MKLQGSQEMQASVNFALYSSSIHLAVVTDKTFSSFLPEFLPPGCDENVTTFWN